MGLKIAIVGATGAVGREVLKTLHQRPKSLDLAAIDLWASPRSAGNELIEGCHSYRIKALSDDTTLTGYDVVFFTAGSAIARSHGPRAAAAGALVIDNSSLFRMDTDVPLVVPEVNGATLELAMGAGSRRIVANPNCTTAQMVVALKPLHDAFGLKRVVLSSYQAVSGKGQQGIEEFERQVNDFAHGQDPEARAFPHPIAFNCLPHIDVFDGDTGYTGEEKKVMAETKKIMGLPQLPVVATCVRVPVLNCHSESVNTEFERPVTVAEARRVLEAAPGVRLYDDPSKNQYPLATIVSGQDDVYVGRLRVDPSVPHGLALWIVGDNLRKGAALNAVQIMEEALKRGYLRG
jgi:aspartate-semialdehyde dehydrogenase